MRLLVLLSIIVLATAVSASTPADCPYLDALTLLYDSTGGPYWTNNARWFSDSCPCPNDGNLPWNGIGCLGTSIYSFMFGGNNMTGTLPYGFFPQVSNITQFTLSDNFLSGTIPSDISAVSQLSGFHISNNSFTGDISFIKSFTKAINIDLKYNQFSGTIPDLNESSLVDLYLGFNQLEGTFPASLLNLTDLSVLSLNNNKLTGTLPSLSYEKKFAFEILYLSDNEFTGTIPSWISSSALHSLITLDLSNNKLSGPFPNLTNPNYVAYFNISGNNFEGEIPASFWLSPTYFDISHNKISGSLPEFLGNSANPIFIILNDNEFSGTVPDSFGLMSQQGSLRRLDLSHNELSGPVPDFWNTTPSYNLDISHNRFDCPLPSWCSEEADGGNGMCAPCGSGSSGLDAGEITLIVLGSLFGAALVLALFAAASFLIYKKYKASESYETIVE